MLSKLLTVADSAYPENFISRFFDLKTGKEKRHELGDTLALFIGREIIGVFDDTQTLAENACNVYAALDTAIDELRRVRTAIENLG